MMPFALRSVCNSLKNEGRAFRNIGNLESVYFPDREISFSVVLFVLQFIAD